MRVLFLTYDFPYPTTSGGKARAYNLLKHIESGNTITLFSFVRSDYNPAYSEELKRIGVSNIITVPRRGVRDFRNAEVLFRSHSVFRSLYYEPSLAKKLYDIVVKEKIDIIHYESFYTAFYLEKSFTEMGIKQIYGSENIEHLLYEEYVRYKAPLLAKPFFLVQAKRIKREEEHMVRSADTTLAITESEKNYFKTLTNKPVFVIENGVSLTEYRYHTRQKKDKRVILFVGNFDYFPNEDAVLFFYHKVFKSLKAKNVVFSIVGKGSERFAKLHDSNIRMTEYLPDIKDAYNEADVFVSPISIGGGTNFKILEAMASGLPVVSFADRVKDIGAIHERDVLVADDPHTFIEQVDRLLSDHDLSEKLAKNARKIIEEKYAWERIGQKLSTVWKELT